MEDYLKEAVGIAKAQAAVRNMTAEDIALMVRRLAFGIKGLAERGRQPADAIPHPPIDPKKAIKERTITCLESGRRFKILTRRHLARYGLTPEEYREKWGYAKGTALCSKSLARERRQRIKALKPWEERRKAGAAPA